MWSLIFITILSTAFVLLLVLFGNKKVAIGQYIASKCHPHVINIVSKLKSKSHYYPAPFVSYDWKGLFQTGLHCAIRCGSSFVKGVWFRQYLVRYKREKVMMSDGGTIAIDWAFKTTPSPHLSNNDTPIVILNHGMAGSSQSEYVIHFAYTLLSAGYRVGVMVNRGCGGLEFTSGPVFQGRKTSDIHEVVTLLRGRYSQAKLFWVGYSLGAAKTLQYLGEYDALHHCTDEIVVTHNSGETVSSSAAVTDEELFALFENSKKNNGSSSRKSKKSGGNKSEAHDNTNTNAGQCSSDDNSRNNSNNGNNNGSTATTSASPVLGGGGLTAVLCVSPPWDMNNNVLSPSSSPLTSALLSFFLKLHLLKHYSYLKVVDATSQHTAHSETQSNEHSKRHKTSGSTATTDTNKTIQQLRPLTRWQILFAPDMMRLDKQCSEVYGDTYGSLENYYKHSDSSPLLCAHKIHTPTLAISAEDDPICSHVDCPTEPCQLGPGLVVLKSPYGGHVGFPEGIFPHSSSYTDRLALEWFAAFCDENPSSVDAH